VRWCVCSTVTIHWTTIKVLTPCKFRVQYISIMPNWSLMACIILIESLPTQTYIFCSWLPYYLLRVL